MPNAKNRLQIFKISYLQVAGILLLIIFAALMMWFNHVNSTQAISATVAKVRFYGEYRIGDRQWQEITEGQHIPATKGDVTLRGNFHMLTPDGEYVGVYRGELPVAFYSNHISLTIYEGSNEPFVMDIENADKAYPYADVQAFFSPEAALDYAEKFGCDVLLCEINPPRLEGLFLAEKVKKINPKVNIIFVTVCSESEHAKAVMRLKPSGYLTKEATNAQILEELQNLRYPVA